MLNHWEEQLSHNRRSRMYLAILYYRRSSVALLASAMSQKSDEIALPKSCAQQIYDLISERINSIDAEQQRLGETEIDRVVILEVEAVRLENLREEVFYAMNCSAE